jgi:cytochrome c biogenesis protein CcmG/thiol:disulfide interchange protein DsbE
VTESTGPTRGSRRIGLALLPLILFAGLVTVFLAQMLRGGANSEIPSALIGKPAPEFSLPALAGLRDAAGGQVPELSTANLRNGKVHVVNVWASWCAPCRLEHPLLMELAKDDRIALAGINYKDQPENALRFLGQLGNPFARVGADEKGRSTIDWGVYGVPETFVVDGSGIIRLKHVGPLTETSVRQKLLPAIEAALAGAGS